MSAMGPVTNVYYLAPPIGRSEPLAAALPLRLRLLELWWRVRLTAAEVTGALRRFGRPPVDAHSVFLDHYGELVLTPTRPVGPARIIDFAAARKRLRA